MAEIDGRAAMASEASGSRPPCVAYILRSYPRLSQTFILNEILALERLGLKLCIFAMTDPKEPIVQEAVRQVRAPVRMLGTPRFWRLAAVGHARVALAEPRRYFGTFAYLLRRGEIDSGYVATSRFSCFGHAVRLAHVWRGESAPRITHIHAHFAHDPTLIALLLHRLTGVPFSFTAHARDLYQTPPTAVAERIAAASAAVTCCRANLEYMTEVAHDGGGSKVRVIHHGVDLDAFRPAGDRPSSDVPLIVSIGRLVEKKGFVDLLAACDRLRQDGRSFRCAIYGDGPLRGELAAMIDRLALGGHVSLAGSRTQDELCQVLRQADLFALTPFVTDDGDRDGIPNVVIEAMACGLPVVATSIGGIADAVTDGETGLLAPPRDVATIAERIGELLGDEPLRRHLGDRARQAVVENFDLRVAAGRLAGIFNATLEVS